MKRALAVALFALLAACAPKEPLSVMGQVPEFELVAQDGKVFSSKTLDGHVWVADFIFTTCRGPCPMMTSHMSKLQAQTGPDVKLVSFTVDPEHDTPPVLAEYAKHFRQDPSRWFFLTGEQKKLSDLGEKAFMLNAVDGTLTHSTRFVLVDRKRRIRGFYHTGEGDFLPQLMRDIATLERETT